MEAYLPLGAVLVFVLLYVFSCIRIVNEYERAVIFRLGRVLGSAKGPGIFIIFPPIDKMIKVSLRTVTLDVPSQDVITRDNVSILINAVVYFRVFDPVKSVIDVEDYFYATSQMAQTTLRSIAGELELDQILAERERINAELQKIIDTQTDPWGVKVSAVEIKHVDLPQEMKRAMAQQAEAERSRRSKVIRAEGEYQASKKLTEAAGLFATEPISVQLRYLQTLVELGTSGSTILAFPLPLDLFKALTEKRQGNKGSESQDSQSDSSSGESSQR